MNKLLFAFLGTLAFLLPTQAQSDAVQMELFYGRECPHCHEQLAWMERDDIVGRYGIDFTQYEVWHNTENADLQQQRIDTLGLDVQRGQVPLTIFDDGACTVLGFDQVRISAYLQTGTCLEDGGGEATWWQAVLQWSWPVMALVLGLIDGFNPCAMWSLIVLLGFLLAMEDRRKMWLIGGIFIGASAVMYFAALSAYLFGFEAASAVLQPQWMSWVFIGVGGIALLVGAQSFWVMVPGVIVLAVAVNSVELLCSFAIPTAFTATIVSLDLSLAENIIALLLYDFTYILDDLVLFTIAITTMNLTHFSPKYTRWSHLFGGIFLLIIGALLILNPSIMTSLLG